MALITISSNTDKTRGSFGKAVLHAETEACVVHTNAG